ncbi:MAG: transcriptional repressor [Alphaproteobacteria bacterium]|jgi:Fur family zinc uptake transcriptional regulator
MARPLSLKAPADKLVLKVLQKAKEPMTAYMLLDELKQDGIKSAPIIYRALDILLKNGSIHSIKELGAYVACDCDASHNHSLAILTVCGNCSVVDEIHDHKIIHQFEDLKTHGIHLQQRAVIELPIVCNNCTI